MKNACLLFAAVASFLIGTLAVAAPAAKPKEEKLPPPTEEQFAASANNLKQIAIAFHNYHAAFATLPTNLYADKKPLLSWRVQILPFVEEEELYKQFKLDEPWDSEHNKKLIGKMPKLYAPVRVKPEAGLTFYQGFTGSHGLLEPGKYTLATIPDGSSNTFLVVEASKPISWTRPSDLEFNGKDLPELGGMFDGRFHAVRGDGTVDRFRKGIKADVLAKLIDPNDGLVLNLQGSRDDEK